MDILFDLGHHEFIKPFKKRWKIIPERVLSLGGTIDIYKKPLITKVIDKYDIFVLGDPENSYLSQFEINVILDFVEKGGGLFLLSEWGGDDRVGSNLNELSQYFGIVFKNDIARDKQKYGREIYPIIDNFEKHSITDGVKKHVYLHGCSLDCGYPSTPIAYLSENGIPANAPVMACSHYGNGRVFAIGDCSSFGDWDENNAELFDNFILFDNIIKWLCGKGKILKSLPQKTAVTLRSKASMLRRNKQFNLAANKYMESYEASLKEEKPKNASYVLLSASECFAQSGDIKSSIRILNLATTIAQREKWDGALQKIPTILNKIIELIDSNNTSVKKNLSKLPKIQLLDNLIENDNIENKGKKFEDIAMYALSLIDGFSISGKNFTTDDGSSEIDIRILNRSSDPIIRHFGPILLGECKAYRKAAPAKDIRNFTRKISEKKLTTGLFVALNGVSGNLAKGNYSYASIRNARQDGIIILILNGKDLRDIISGGDPIDILLQRYDEVYAF